MNWPASNANYNRDSSRRQSPRDSDFLPSWKNGRTNFSVNSRKKKSNWSKKRRKSPPSRGESMNPDWIEYLRKSRGFTLLRSHLQLLRRQVPPPVVTIADPIVQHQHLAKNNNPLQLPHRLPCPALLLYHHRRKHKVWTSAKISSIFSLPFSSSRLLIKFAFSSLIKI